MMRKFMYIGAVFVALVSFGSMFFSYKNTHPVLHKIIRATPTQVQIQERRSIFVPWWSFDMRNEDIARYDCFYYFAKSIRADGTMNSGEDDRVINEFFSATHGKERYIVLKFASNEEAILLLQNKNAHDTLQHELTQLIQQYNPDGIAFDLELSVIPLSKTNEQIEALVSAMKKATQQEKKHFSVIMYGDMLYRPRPYNLHTIARLADEVMVMAYDFHKSRGEPGPNFPFAQRELYGYDFKLMVADFLSEIPSSKLSIILGMYGYDWTLGSQGKPLKSAISLTTQQIISFISQSCARKDCVNGRNTSGEPFVKYIDSEGYNHVIWYEDEVSSKNKIDYLKKRGVESVAYWANGYFNGEY